MRWRRRPGGASGWPTATHLLGAGHQGGRPRSYLLLPRSGDDGHVRPGLEITAYRDDMEAACGDPVNMPLAMPSPPVDQLFSPAINGNIVELRRRLKTSLPVTNVTGVPCQREDAGLWFSKLPAELNLAKAYCGGCRNRQSCLAGALERAEPAGVWGGEIFEDGHIIAFKRSRGRPRKSACRDDQK